MNTLWQANAATWDTVTETVEQYPPNPPCPCHTNPKVYVGWNGGHLVCALCGRVRLYRAAPQPEAPDAP